jgi:hypothetical protein
MGKNILEELFTSKLTEIPDASIDPYTTNLFRILKREFLGQHRKLEDERGK